MHSDLTMEYINSLCGEEIDIQSYLESVIQFINPAYAYQKMMDLLKERLHADSARIIVKDVLTGKLETRASTVLNTEDEEYSDTILAKIVDENQSLCIANAIEMPDLSTQPSISKRDFLSVIAVPLHERNEKVIGAIYLDRYKKDIRFTEQDKEIVEKASDILTPVIVQQEREKMELELLRSQHDFEGIIGKSPLMIKLRKEIEQVAPFNKTVLINGESGTGKELVARAIHNKSKRKDNSFIAVNCGAIADNLLESELFGYVKGAFTGANEDKKGYFSAADGGTLFLDEIGDAPLNIQVKLLRAIQEQEIMPVGATKPVKVDVRLLCATNKNLRKEVAQKRFREDLFYRIHSYSITIPPLRKRGDDIILLAKHFLAQFCKKNEYPIQTPQFTDDAYQRLRMDSWKGNVRELKNKIEAAAIKNAASNKHRYIRSITIEQLFPETKIYIESGNLQNALTGNNWKTIQSKFEEIVFENVLIKNDWNITKSADFLGVSRKTVYKKIEKYELKEK
jgi:transcriptional regulator with GAF, ATPase, and Fis domain